MRLPHALGLLTTTALVATTLGLALPAVAADKTQVTVLTIGYPDKDTTDAATGAVSPGIDKLEAAFEAANPTIDLVITNIPWVKARPVTRPRPRRWSKPTSPASTRCRAPPATPSAACCRTSTR